MKEKKALLAWAGIWLAILAAVLYAVFYGKPNGSMNSMSWLSFWLLLGAGAFAAAATLLKKAQIGSYLLALCSLIAFVLSIYAFYPYISAAFVGIDSTWETSFFVVIGLMLACSYAGSPIQRQSPENCSAGMCFTVECTAYRWCNCQ